MIEVKDDAPVIEKLRPDQIVKFIGLPDGEHEICICCWQAEKDGLFDEDLD